MKSYQIESLRKRRRRIRRSLLFPSDKILVRTKSISSSTLPPPPDQIAPSSKDLHLSVKSKYQGTLRSFIKAKLAYVSKFSGLFIKFLTSLGESLNSSFRTILISMSMLICGPEHKQQQTLMMLQGQQQQQRQQKKKRNICGPQTETKGARDYFSEQQQQLQQQQQQQQQQQTKRVDMCKQFAQSTQHDPQELKICEYFPYVPIHSSSSNMNQANNKMHFKSSNLKVSQGEDGNPLVLVSKRALSDLTNKITFSMDKMRDLEEQVRVIPELQRCLQHVIDTDSNSSCRNFRRSSDLGSDITSNRITNLSTKDQNHITSSSKRDKCNTNNLVKSANSPLQRHRFNSFRLTQASSNSPREQDSDAGIVNRFNMRSPVGSFRAYNNLGAQCRNDPIKHRASSDMSRLSKATTTDTLRSTTEKVEYEDLINDLISLSYSANYHSSSNSNSAHSHTSSQSQVIEHKVNKPEHCMHKQQQQQQRYFSSSTHLNQTSVNSTPHNQPNDEATLNNQSGLSSNSSARMSNYSLNTNYSPTNHKHIISSTSSNDGARAFNCTDTINTCNHSPLSTRTIKNNSISPDSNSPLHNNCFNNQRNRNNVLSAFTSFYSNQTTLPSGSSSRSMIIDSSSPTPPVRPQLDCGCQSFKEHLRYNSLSREQRLNQAARSQSLRCSKNNVSHQSSSNKVDASTNTDLTINDIVTRSELNSLLENMRKSYSKSPESTDHIDKYDEKYICKTSSPESGSNSSASVSVVKSSTPLDSRSDLSDLEDRNRDAQDREITVEKVDFHSKRHDSSSGNVNEYDDDEDDENEDEECTNEGSGTGEEPYSLGSSYRDPSDFEEYCAYGHSLERRTKDFMSPTTKIPNDLRFALIRLNDFIKRKRSLDQIESASGCIEVVRAKWFEVAGNKDSQASKTKLYVDYFESLTKQLLNSVVNLTDRAGNTAMHYAASYYKLDIVRILLDTKVCDVNCRNKAGYTPIMLLALADLESTEEQEVARQLFSIGDVNIKARSSGQTALMLAASNGKLETCRLLLECGADPSLQDFEGSTALMCGSEIGHEGIVRILLAQKLTDPSATDNDGLDALTIAMNNGHKNIGLLLYTAKNVPRMQRPPISLTNQNTTSAYMGASLRRNRGKLATNYVKRADSLLNSRTGQLVRRSVS